MKRKDLRVSCQSQFTFFLFIHNFNTLIFLVLKSWALYTPNFRRIMDHTDGHSYTTKVIALRGSNKSIKFKEAISQKSLMLWVQIIQNKTVLSQECFNNFGSILKISLLPWPQIITCSSVELYFPFLSSSTNTRKNKCCQWIMKI